MEIGLADQDASFHLIELASRLARLFTKHPPDVVISHPYEGGHPDHDACALAVHTAIGDMKREKLPVPLLMEFTSYHAQDGRMVTGQFLPFEGCEEVAFVLTP